MHPSHSAVGLLHPSHAAFLNNTYLLTSFQDLQEKAGAFSSTPQPVSGTTGRGIEWEAETTRMAGGRPGRGEWRGGGIFSSWNWALSFYPLNFHFLIYKLINIYDHFPQIKLFSHLKPVFCQSPFHLLNPLRPCSTYHFLVLYISANPWFQPLFPKYALIFPILSHFKPKSPSNSTSLHPNNFSINSQFALLLFSR